MIAFLNMLDTEDEKEKFSLLYDTYKNLLFWIAYSKTHNNEDAEECVQETFFYVAENFGKIGDVKSQRTKNYLATIVTGFAIDIYNNYRKTQNDTEEAVEDLNIAVFENYEKADLLDVFDNALDEESKVFFYLKYLYGYKSREIAQMYKVNDTYVRKKIQYAKEKIRKTLEKGDM